MPQSPIASRPTFRAAIWLPIAILSLTRPAAAQESVATSGVFQRYAEQVVKIQVVETGSAAKVGVGTGFFVTADGSITTNYHVVSEKVHDPHRHRVELVDAAGKTPPLEIRAVDVVHDLAVLRSTTLPARHFKLAAVKARRRPTSRAEVARPREVDTGSGVAGFFFQGSPKETTRTVGARVGRVVKTSEADRSDRPGTKSSVTLRSSPPG